MSQLCQVFCAGQEFYPEYEIVVIPSSGESRLLAWWRLKRVDGFYRELPFLVYPVLKEGLLDQPISFFAVTGKWLCLLLTIFSTD